MPPTQQAANKGGAWIWIVLAVALFFGFKQCGGDDDGDAKQAGSSLFGDNKKERAERITQQLVSNSLRSPGSASFTEFRVLDQNGPYFQTYIGVDAQNGFGALIRSYFVCVFKLEDGDQFSSHRFTAVNEVETFDHGLIDGPSVPEEEMMELQKSSIGWPGYDSDGE